MAVLLAQTSPEGFLVMLCDTASTPGGPVCWFSSASSSADPGFANLDTLRSVLPGLRELSVVPGPPELLEVDEASMAYTVSFPEAEWTWMDDGGRIHRVRGETLLEQSGGVYRWIALPVHREGFSAGPGERIFVGFTFTLLVIAVALVFVWWARKRIGITGR
jgi:hypothetical protein